MTDQPNEGWIEWGGGDCPVAPETVVVVEFRDGTVTGEDPAGAWNWVEDGGGTIIRYRLVSPTPSEADRLRERVKALQEALTIHDAACAECPVDIAGNKGRRIPDVCPHCHATESDSCGKKDRAAIDFIAKARALLSPEVSNAV